MRQQWWAVHISRKCDVLLVWQHGQELILLQELNILMKPVDNEENRGNGTKIADSKIFQRPETETTDIHGHFFLSSYFKFYIKNAKKTFSC